ncbi:MAG: histidine--tRNA ligase [Vicingaceae bacterium]
MRDFSPTVMAKRNYIFNTIRKSFELHGFEQIETPAMENLETLTGKYGEEGDRLIFSVLNSGEKLTRGVKSALKKNSKGEVLAFNEFKEVMDAAVDAMETGDYSEKALRYDLTVPFARYVVQHQNEIAFPFRRFQIQPVWRADRPQKGRYREFYQCDADIIGSDSLLNEVELIKIFDEVLSQLGLQDFSIKMNNRKVLSGIAEVIGRPDKIVDITVAIDKLEKIGIEKVNEELSQKGLSENEIDQIQPLFELKGDNDQVISKLKDYLKTSDVGQEGIAEIEKILRTVNCWSLKKAKLEVDVTLARGLDYYTGAIFEVSSNEVKMGSICGGGRYADLTGIFGLKDMSGVGISFGADRIYDVMEELALFPNQLSQSTQLLFINFGEKEENYVLPLLEKAREKGIRAELYPDSAKMKKQMKYADQKHIPFVVLIGEEEMKSGQLTLKEMESGTQSSMDFTEILNKIPKAKL